MKWISVETAPADEDKYIWILQINKMHETFYKDVEIILAEVEYYFEKEKKVWRVRTSDGVQCYYPSNDADVSAYNYQFDYWCNFRDIPLPLMEVKK